MADVDIDDVIECTQKGLFKGTDAVVNVWQAKITDPAGGTKAEALIWAKEWLLDLFDAITLSVSDETTLIEAIVDNLTQVTFLGQVLITDAGSDTGEALPPQCCGLVIARTGVSTVDGRKYLGVFGEAFQDGGTWDGATLGAMAALGDKWDTTFVASNAVEGIGVIVTKPLTVPADVHTITGTRVITGVRTQRRRTIGRGA